MAAVLACGRGARLTGAAAIALRGAWRGRPPAVTRVVVPHRVRPLLGVDVRTTSDLPRSETTVVDGVPVVTLERAIVDLADEVTADVLANVIHEAMFVRGRLSLPRLRRCIERRGHCPGPAHRRAVAAVRLYETGSAGRLSMPESLVYAALVERGWEVHLNAPFDPGDGGDTWRPDLGHDARRTIVEIDGAAGHARPGERRRDRDREARALAAGFRTIRIPARRALVDLRHVLEEIEDAFGSLRR
jgi:hypothetical protein